MVMDNYTYTEPNQTMRIVMPVDGKNIPLRLGFYYNSEGEYWTGSVTDDATGVLLADSVPFLDGIYPSANILQQLAYLKIGSAVLLKTDPDIPFENPDDKTLGAGFDLIWGDTISNG